MRSFLGRAVAVILGIGLIVPVVGIGERPARGLDPLSVPNFTLASGANPYLFRLNFTADSRARYEVRVYNYVGATAYVFSSDYTPGTDVSRIADPSPSANCATVAGNLPAASGPASFPYCNIFSNSPELRRTAIRVTLVVYNRSTNVALPESPKSPYIGFLGLAAGTPTVVSNASGASVQLNAEKSLAAKSATIDFYRSDDYSTIFSTRQQTAMELQTNAPVSLPKGYSYSVQMKLVGGVVGQDFWVDSPRVAVTLAPFYVPTTPNSVTNVALRSTSSNQLVVSWTPPSGGPTVGSYRVALSENRTTWVYGNVSTVSAPATSLQIDGPAAGGNFIQGTRYYARVEARGVSPDNGYSAAAVSTEAVAPGYAPTAPDVTYTAADGKISAKWSVSYDGGLALLGYDIEVDRDGTRVLTKSASGNFTSGELLGLTNGVKYTVRVRVKNSAGWSAYSDDATVTPLGTPEPTTQDATAISATTATVAVKFNAKGISTDLYVEYWAGEGAAPSSPSRVLVQSGVTSDGFVGAAVLSKLSPGTLYSARAVGMVGYTRYAASTWVQFTTTLATPTITSTTATATTGTITWATPQPPANVDYSWNVWVEKQGVYVDGCKNVRSTESTASCEVLQLNEKTLYGVRIQANVVGGMYSGGASLVATGSLTTKATQSMYSNEGSMPKLYVGMPDLALGTYVTASSGLSVVITSSTPTTCVVTNMKLVPKAAGTCILSAAQAGDSSFAAAESRDMTLTIAATQEISFSLTAYSSKTVSDSPFSIATSASATSGLSVSFDSSTPEVCSVSGSTVTPLKAQTCTIVASQAGNDSYLAATNVVRSISIGRGTQSTLVLTATTKPFNEAITDVVAGGSGTGVVSYTVSGSGNTANCQAIPFGIAAGQPGECSVVATKAGDADYLSKSSSSATMTFTKAAQTIYVPQLKDALQGSTVGVNAVATSGLTVAVVSKTTGVCTVASGVITLNNVGTCTIEATQSGSSNYEAATAVTRSLESNTKATPQTGNLFREVRTYVIGDTVQFEVQATVNTSLGYRQSDVPGTFSWYSDRPDLLSFADPSVGTATILGRGPVPIQVYYLFTPTGSSAATHNPASGGASLIVSRTPQPLVLAPQTVAYDGPARLSVTGVLGTGRLSYNFSPTDENNLPAAARNADCTITGTTVTRTAPGSCVVRATLDMDDIYETASAVREFVFTKKPQELRVDNTSILEALTYADKDRTIDLSTMIASSQGLTPTVSTTSSACSVSAGVLSIISAGVCTLDLAQSGSDTVVAATYSFSFRIGKAVQSSVSLATRTGTYGSVIDLVSEGGTGAGSVAFEVADGTATGCRMTGSQLVSTTAGTCLVTVTRAGDDNHLEEVSPPTAVILGKIGHTLSFSFDSLTTVAAGASAIDLTRYATVSSGLTTRFRSATPDICTVENAALTALVLGECLVESWFEETETYVGIAARSAGLTVTARSSTSTQADPTAAGPTASVATKPAPPRSVVLKTKGSRVLEVSWLAPESAGKDISYAVTLQPGGRTCIATTLSCVFSNLDPSVAYVATVVAVGSGGRSDSVSSGSLAPIVQIVPGRSVALRSLIPSPPKGVQTWKATGACSVRGRQLVVRAKPGTCRVTLTIAGKPPTKPKILRFIVKVSK